MKSAMRQKWEGRWDQLTGRVKQLWGEITDDELMEAQGDYERLIGLIEEKTGETREAIEAELDDEDDDEV